MYIYIYIDVYIYDVKYIHICIMFLINNEQSLKTTLAFAVKLGCSRIILSI